MLLRIDNLFAHYDGFEVLKGISLCVKESELVAIIGPNGAGKTTVLKAIFGLVKKSRGEILFNERHIEYLKPNRIAQLGISFVPQGRNVFRSMSVQENLEMGAFLVRDKELIRKNLNKVYELFPVLAKRRKQISGTLSGGEQQMLAFGRALMLKPKLLLLDEPSLGLAPIFLEEVFQKIVEINKEGITILVVEQNVNMVLGIAQRGYLMEEGKIILEDVAKSLSSHEKIVKTYLGG